MQGEVTHPRQVIIKYSHVHTNEVQFRQVKVTANVNNITKQILIFHFLFVYVNNAA